MRAKWSAPIRKYWKISEQTMVKYCDLAICDSVNIEKYIHECYDGKGIKGRNPKTTFIAYGADLTLSKLADDDEKLVNWYKEKGLTKKGYYLVVGRFVPENSFEVMIREFMKSKSKKDFAIITNVNDKFLNELEEKLHFKSDERIKFVGTVYDQELLKKIREKSNVFAKVAAGVFAANGVKVNIWPVLMPVPSFDYKGDTYFVPAGTVHGIGKGILVAEIQESSNVTYRVYDYDRVDKNGKKRELHFDKAVQVMNMKVAPDVSQRPRIVKYYSGCSRELLCRCKYFETERIQVTKGFAFSVMDTSFQVLMCLNGYVEVQTMDAEQKPMRFSKGETMFLSAGLGRCLVVGDAELIKVRC